MITQLIKDFINKFGKECSENEDLSTIELFMDDHTFIEWDNKGYYIPKDSSFYTEEDEILKDMINKSYEPWAETVLRGTENEQKFTEAFHTMVIKSK